MTVTPYLTCLEAPQAVTDHQSTFEQFVNSPNPNTGSRVAVYDDCVVLAGSMAAVAASLRAVAARGSWAMLVHRRDGRSMPPARLGERAAESFLTTDPYAEGLPSPLLPVIALAVPTERVSATPLAQFTALAGTPLVRASRPMLWSLEADGSHIDRDGHHAVSDALITVLRGILREHPAAVPRQSTTASLIVRLRALVEQKHTDPRLDVAQLARELHTSRRHLYRHVDGDGGIASMITERRITTAKELLARRPDLTITEVAEHSGFANASRLRAQFSRYAGMTPTHYRRTASPAATAPLRLLPR